MLRKLNFLIIICTAVLLTACFGGLLRSDKDYTQLYVVLENNTANLECTGDSTDVNITVSNPEATTAKTVTVFVPDQAQKYIQVEVQYGEQLNVKVTAASDSTKILDSKDITVKYVRGWNDPPSPRIGYCKEKGIKTEFLE